MRATNDSPPSLDPEVVARIRNLELRAREIVEGSISGRHRSPQHGHSVEFAQHREYVPGDDLRHLDWKVWAKADRLYVKQFVDETNLRATLLLDTSASMQYGKGDANKAAFARQLVAALAYLLLRQSDSVGLLLFDDRIRQETPHRTASGHLHAILQAMAVDPTTEKTDLPGVLAQLAERSTPRGMIVLVSDLLADRAGVMRGLKLLRQRRHDLIVLHLLHDDEVDFPFQGSTRFEAMESADALTCDPKSLRDGYLEALRRYLQDLRQFCSQTGIDYRFARTGHSVDAVLAALLHERSRA